MMYPKWIEYLSTCKGLFGVIWYYDGNTWDYRTVPCPLRNVCASSWAFSSWKGYVRWELLTAERAFERCLLFNAQLYPSVPPLGFIRWKGRSFSQDIQFIALQREAWWTEKAICCCQKVYFGLGTRWCVWQKFKSAYCDPCSETWWW